LAELSNADCNVRFYAAVVHWIGHSFVDASDD